MNIVFYSNERSIVSTMAGNQSNTPWGQGIVRNIGLEKGISKGFLHGFGLPELLILVVIIILLFGAGRISKIAGELGKGIRAFKDGIKNPSQDFEEEK
jgi:sec-independent protein translocase protein TatA